MKGSVSHTWQSTGGDGRRKTHLPQTPCVRSLPPPFQKLSVYLIWFCSHVRRQGNQLVLMHSQVVPKTRGHPAKWWLHTCFSFHSFDRETPANMTPQVPKVPFSTTHVSIFRDVRVSSVYGSAKGPPYVPGCSSDLSSVENRLHWF